MISILIPTYNFNVLPLVGALHKELSSVEVDWEIRVYDDGSTANSEENLTLHTFPHTVFKKLPTNIGRTAIRSLMAEEAQYNWLLFLDADVLPKNYNFIQKYLKHIEDPSVDLCVGGIIYENKKPEKEFSLRWAYGKAREAKSAKMRMQNPFVIVSANLLIRKSVFLKANSALDNFYGLDILFGQRLQELHAKAIHIDNPVYHLGLEENSIFLKKSLKAVETTVILENKRIMETNLRPLQLSYVKLKNLGLVNIFSYLISPFEKTMEKNFLSNSPNLFWFDLYRLNYYIKLKKKDNA